MAFNRYERYIGTAPIDFLARLNEVQEELFYYPRRWHWVGVGIGSSGVSKMLKLYVKVFYVMGKALSGELSCPCDWSCFRSPGSSMG